LPLQWPRGTAILRPQPTRFPKSSQGARMQSHTAELEGGGAAPTNRAQGDLGD
jgi:hypothetical protein